MRTCWFKLKRNLWVFVCDFIELFNVSCRPVRSRLRVLKIRSQVSRSHSSRIGTNRKRKYGTPVTAMHSAGNRSPLARSQNQPNRARSPAYLQQVQQQEEELQ